MTSGPFLSILLALSAQTAPPGTAAGNPLPPYAPLRAPLLAGACATPDDAELHERLTSFCAGYVTAVLENDPRLADCHPFRAEVMDAIVARHRATPLADNDVLARDFVVAVARELCHRRPS